MKENNFKSKKSWLKWFFVFLVLLFSLLAYGYFKFDRDAKLSRENQFFFPILPRIFIKINQLIPLIFFILYFLFFIVY